MTDAKETYHLHSLDPVQQQGFVGFVLNTTTTVMGWEMTPMMILAVKEPM